MDRIWRRGEVYLEMGSKVHCVVVFIGMEELKVTRTWETMVYDFIMIK